MKWKCKDPHVKVGDKRIIEKFAFFPIKIEQTIVWLEKYYVLQEYDFGVYTRNYYYFNLNWYLEKPKDKC